MSKQDDKILAGATALLEPGEEFLASIVASARGHAAQMASGGVSGTGKQGIAHAASSSAGLAIASPMGLVVTSRRLLTLRLGMIIGLGMGGSVKGLLGSVPVGDVDSVTVSRVGLSQVIALTVRGAEITLEATVSSKVDALIAAIESAKAAAG